jgi:hypothetical protein
VPESREPAAGNVGVMASVREGAEAEVIPDEAEIVQPRKARRGNRCCRALDSIGQGTLNWGNQMHHLFSRPALARDFEALISLSTAWALIASVQLVPRRSEPLRQHKYTPDNSLTRQRNRVRA